MRQGRELVKLPEVGRTTCRRHQHRLLIGVLCTLCCALAAGTSGPALAQHVLVLNSFDKHTMHSALTTQVLRETLERETGNEISITEMSVDARWNSATREPALAGLLMQRQSYLPVELVIAEGPPAISFWLTYRDQIAPDAPLLSVARQGVFEPGDLRPMDVGFWSIFSFTVAIEDILQVLPDTSHVLIVLGSSDLERQLKRQAEAELEGYRGIEFEYTNNDTFAELQERLKTLSAGSAVYMTMFNTDSEGALIPWHGALDLAAAISPAPIFGPFDEQLGRGIVGGRLIPLRQQSEMIAATAAGVLRGEAVTNRWNMVDLTPPTYDGREFGRWSIDSAQLPGDSIVLFQPEPVWRTHALESALIAAVLAAQALLIGTLLVQRRRLRRSEGAQQALAGQLINAHEEEHRRLARELHDDLSQRLAHLAIETGRLDASLASPESERPLKTLQSQIAAIGEDVHDLSYRLHPSIVDDLGIVTALRSECERVRKHHGMRIVEDIEPLSDPCPRDTALCLYRVCQEAFNNAIRHGRPSTLEVHLSQPDGNVLLEIRDDGCGFTPAAAGSGLGISSMQERARLAGGELTLSSTPGQGTSVRLSIPLATRQAS